MLRSTFAPTRVARLASAALRTRTSLCPPVRHLPLRVAAQRLVVAHPLSTTAILAAEDPKSTEEKRHPRDPAVLPWHEPPTSDRLAPNTQVKFHPLFYSTYFTHITADEAPQGFGRGGEEDEGEEGEEQFDEPDHGNAWDFDDLDDFATEPASRKVRVELVSEVLPLIENPDGVTVRQVFEAIVKHWDTEIPLSKYQERYLRKKFDIPAEEELVLTKRDDLDFLRHVKYSDEYLDGRTQFWASVDDDCVPRFSLYNYGIAAGTHPDNFPQPVGDGPVSRLLVEIPPEDES